MLVAHRTRDPADCQGAKVERDIVDIVERIVGGEVEREGETTRSVDREEREEIAENKSFR